MSPLTLNEFDTENNLSCRFKFFKERCFVCKSAAFKIWRYY